MAETSGCCPASAKADYGLFRFAPEPDISLRRLGDAKGHTETSVATAGSE
jgi:hypothetical protein